MRSRSPAETPMQATGRGLAHYLLCGMKVSSALPLPELCERSGRDANIDVSIRFGRVPERLADCVGATPFLQVARDGACRVEIPTVASFLVESGRDVVIAPTTDPPSPDIVTFVSGVVLALLCHQRALVPLHAACVCIDGEAIALAGASGSGKSALAAALACRGHTLLADDVCVLDLGPCAAAPCVRPASPCASLWRDTLDALGVCPEGLTPHRMGQQRYRIRLSNSASRAAHGQEVPLRAIYVLGATAGDEPEGLRPLEAETAIAAIAGHVHCRRATAWMEREQALLGEMSCLADVVPVARLHRRPGLDRLGAVAELVERLRPGSTVARSSDGNGATARMPAAFT